MMVRPPPPPLPPGVWSLDVALNELEGSPDDLARALQVMDWSAGAEERWVRLNNGLTFIEYGTLVAAGWLFHQNGRWVYPPRKDMVDGIWLSGFGGIHNAGKPIILEHDGR